MILAIKGMEMPRSCAQCRLFIGYCPLNRILLPNDANIAGKRQDDCPLVEIEDKAEMKNETEAEQSPKNEPGRIAEDDHIFRLLMKIKKNIHKDDLHSFKININNGVAFVEAQNDSEVIIRVYRDDQQQIYALPYIAAANKLDQLGADYNTVEM